jgi:hypothetical protein
VRKAVTVRRTILLVVLLTVPAGAAPRLKDRTPAPDAEEARIAALKAKYAAVAASGQPDEKQKLDLAKVKLQIIQLVFDDLARQPATSEARQERERELDKEIRADPILAELYDIAMYDRKKAADKK